YRNIVPSVNLADNAQMVGESFVAVKGIEVTDLSIVVEPQQERHLGVVRSLPNNNSILVTLAAVWRLCGSGRRRSGSARRICPGRCGIRRGIRCGRRIHRSKWLTGVRRIRCRSAIKSPLQTID